MLTFLLTLYAWSQEWGYVFHYRFDGTEVVGDTLLDQTYDLLRGYVIVFSFYQPDSIQIEIKLGNGFHEAMNIQWDKGYYSGYSDKVELEKDWNTVRDVLFGVMIGALTVYGIQQLRSKR